MISIAESISDLLYQNDVLVVPGLGAFLRQNGPAKVNMVTHRLEKPSAVLQFDPNLREDNDVIANYFSSMNDVSLEEARKLLLMFVSDCFNRMKEGKTVSLAGVGTLKFDADQEIVFEQDPDVNYNADAFGLTDFTVTPAFKSKTKDEIREEIAKQQKDKNTPVTVDRKEIHKDDQQKRRFTWWIFKLLLVLVAVALILWYLGYFSLDEWFKGKKPVEPTVTTQPIKPEVSSKAVVDTIPVDSTGLGSLPVPAVDTLHEAKASVDTDMSASSVQDKPSITPDQPVMPDSVEGAVLIIGGCFSREENALKQVNQLIENGYTKAFVQQRGKLWDVCYGRYASEEEATDALREIRKNTNAKAWILKPKSNR